MAFNIADYQEKYRWDGYDMRNTAVQLRIYERTSTPLTRTAIRGMVDIRLQMQGSSAPVYEPIVKTSLTFSLVDAPDLADVGEKSGNWQEFYTPDSTKYLVAVYRNALLSWRGYITPDSWKESLDYRGIVTITARDNLGHLQDLPFDGQGNADGLIKISDIVDGALDAIDCPLTLHKIVSSTDAQTLRDTHDYIIDSYVAVSEFKDASWWDAMEKTLGAIGYTLRCHGSGLYLAPIRNLPLGPHTNRTNAEGNSVDIEFYGGDRELHPAARQITDVMDYGAQMEVNLLNKRSWLYGATTANTYSGMYAGWSTITTYNFTGRSWKNGNTDYATKGGWSDTFGYLNPQRCAIGSALKVVDGAHALDIGVGLAAGQITDGGVLPAWKCKAPTTDVTLRIELARSIQLDNGSFPFTANLFNGYLSSAKVLVKYIDPGNTVWYWQKQGDKMIWDTAVAGPQHIVIIDETLPPDQIPDSYAFDIQLADISAKAFLGGWLVVEFHNFGHRGDNATIYGLFARVTAIQVTLNCKSVLKSNTVNTVNNSDYNVKLERKPAFGALSARVPMFAPANYPKALWAYNGGSITTPVTVGEKYHNTYINYGSTTTATATGWSISDSIPVSAGDILTIQSRGTTQRAVVILTDAAQNYYNTVMAYAVGGEVITTTYTVTANGYVCVCYRTADGLTVTRTVSGPSDVEPVDYAVYLNGYAATTAIPLPAQVAKQILTFVHTPMEILGGTCGAVNKADNVGFTNLVKYKGKTYIVQGGTLDLLKNRITGAMLREFAWYDDMWDENNNPSYGSAPVYETDSTFHGANGNSSIKG